MSIEITFFAKNFVKQEKIIRKLSWRDSWRDPVTGEMNEIIYEDEGGDIEFKYNHKNKRMVPYVVDVFYDRPCNTLDSIKKYVDNLDFPHETVFESHNEITIAIDESNLEGKKTSDVIKEMENSLQESNFCNYEIMPK